MDKAIKQLIEALLEVADTLEWYGWEKRNARGCKAFSRGFEFIIRHHLKDWSNSPYHHQQRGYQLVVLDHTQRHGMKELVNEHFHPSSKIRELWKVAEPIAKFPFAGQPRDMVSHAVKKTAELLLEKVT